jgi:hypothetical protein
MKKLSILTMIAVSLSFLVILVWAEVAAADPGNPKRLHGDYAFTGEAACITSPLGFNLDLTPKGNHFITWFSVQGVWTFNGDGTGTREGRAVSVIGAPFPGASSQDFQAPFTYTLGPDGTFTTVLSSPLTGTVLTGQRAGQTFTIDQIQLTGIISKDKNSLTIASEEPQIETVTYSDGDVHPRICHRSRILLRLGK